MILPGSSKRKRAVATDGGAGSASQPHYLYPEGVDWDIEIPGQPLFTLLDDAVRRYADRPFLDFLGKTYTYGEAGALVDKLAAGFRELGVTKGVKVGLYLPNCPYFIFCYFAVLKTGGTVVTYNPLLAEREIARQIRDSATQIMVTLDLRRLYDKIAKVTGEVGLRKVVLCEMTAILPFPKNLFFFVAKHKERAPIPNDDVHVPFAKLLERGAGPLPCTVDPRKDVAVLLYTGGTTGVPKGVALTHYNIYANTLQCTATLTVARRGRERILAVIPFFHAFGMTAVMNTGIALGAQIILLPRFDVIELLKTTDRKRPTLFAAVPTIFTALIRCPQLQRYDLTSLKLCNSGSDALPRKTKDAFERASGCKILEGYGLTEAGPVVSFNLPGGIDKPGSIGLPIPRTTIEIADMEDAGKTLPPGTRGEICITGPQVMSGYWRDPEATARVVVNGRLYTGDVGYMDEDGYTYLVDRIKDIIKTGGVTVFPRIVEEAIQLHPAVKEVAVVGVPDPYWGERVTACIVLEEGQGLSAEELRAFLKDKISPIESPKTIESRTQLPRSPLGKVLKAALVDEIVKASAGN